MADLLALFFVIFKSRKTLGEILVVVRRGAGLVRRGRGFASIQFVDSNLESHSEKSRSLRIYAI